MTRFAYDGWNPGKPVPVGTENFDIWGVLDGGSSLTSRNLHGDRVDQPFARIDSTTPYWNLTDNLGSVRKVIDNTGVVKDAIVYDAFGNIVSETDSTKRGLYSWTGREIDVETGLQYNRARYYDPVTARWISQDPMGFDAGDSNLYRYVKNSTQTSNDPSGLDVFYLWSPIAIDWAPPWFKNFGHASVLIGPMNNGEWWHYNFDIKSVWTTKENVTINKFPTFEKALFSPELARYKKFLYFRTSAASTANMVKLAEQVRQKGQGYFLLPVLTKKAIFKNCTTFSGTILQAGGIDFDNSKYPNKALALNRSKATYAGLNDDSWAQYGRDYLLDLEEQRLKISIRRKREIGIKDAQFFGLEEMYPWLGGFGYRPVPRPVLVPPIPITP